MQEKLKFLSRGISCGLVLFFLWHPAWAFSLFYFQPSDDTIWLTVDSCKYATPFCADSLYIYASCDLDTLNPVVVECCPGDPPVSYEDSCFLNLHCNNSPTIYHVRDPKWFIMKATSSGEVQIVNFNI